MPEPDYAKALAEEVIPFALIRDSNIFAKIDADGTLMVRYAAREFMVEIQVLEVTGHDS